MTEPIRDAAFWSWLKAEMKKAAFGLGIDDIGVASPEPFTELKGRLIRHRELGYESGFEASDLDKRTDPSLLFEEPRSIIAISVAYPNKLPNPPRSEPVARRGILSRSAWGEDYHSVLRLRLRRLEQWLQERVPELRAESMVDTGELSDRAVAERAGIGWTGKNSFIMNRKHGTFMYLAEMITNLPLEPDSPLQDSCGSCTKCIDACPTGALVGPGQLNAQRCISYVTQTKEMVSDELMRKIGNRLYGCDTCQIVCPVNRGVNVTRHPEFEADAEQVKPLLLPLLNMSNREFKERYGTNASSWRGKKPIQRNAVIALGNFRETSAVPELAALLKDDPRPVLRGTAAWALGRIGGAEAEAALEAAVQRESDDEARSWAERSLAALRAEKPSETDQKDFETAKL
ncbi:tRNA epoxyqueuosine(34) reductase QueG [Paenibacillus pasadenensis]|uniref:tRNA epoxyqueuosine(34) reductase QueG n=1 Tax=Paenibacillus pasadenensis TaxID=217090 RepID=UPI00203BE371|nr:tRNA epoxyqueuosine(34) reductase QueG [Paenibacillus pasadenensis]MCM3748437.1 tRNA epoxyqueuosine(34) reductase QueG [Paenibacillus pasadenensis]